MILHPIVVITLTQFFCFIIPAFSIPLQTKWEDTNSFEMSNTFQDDDDDTPDFLFPKNPIFQQIPGIPMNEPLNNLAESGNSTDNGMSMSNMSSTQQQQQQSQDVQETVEKYNDASTPSDVELEDSQLLEALFSMVDYEVETDYLASDSRGAVHEEEKHYLENGVETYYSYNKTVISTTNNN